MHEEANFGNSGKSWRGNKAGRQPRRTRSQSGCVGLCLACGFHELNIRLPQIVNNTRARTVHCVLCSWPTHNEVFFYMVDTNKYGLNESLLHFIA